MAEPISFFDHGSARRHQIHHKAPNVSVGTQTRSQIVDNAFSRPSATSSDNIPASAEAADTRLPKLKVMLATEDDPLYVVEFFRIFFAELPHDQIEVCGVTIDRAFHEPLWRTLRRIYQLYGPWGLFRIGLRFFFVRLRSRSIESLARSLGATVIRPQSVNHPEYLARLRAIAPDVIVSVAAPEIFKAELLRIPRLGCINIHSGRLPEYRGMMPTFWQMQRGERAVTITVHCMSERLDTGDVLATQSFPIGTPDSLDRIIKGTKCEGARLMIRVLQDLREGRTQPQPLDMRRARYFSFPKQKDVLAFRRLGHRLL